MSPGYRYQVAGLRELQRDLRRADAEAAKLVKAALRQVGDLVKNEAVSRGSRFAGIGPYKTYVRQRGVSVEQSKGKVTGTRGDFGLLQMRSVLEPALDEREGEVYDELEQALDRIADIVD